MGSAKPTPELSVVIPVRNGGPDFVAQLSALAAQDLGRHWELIVADNGSTDDTVAAAQSFAAQVPALQVVDASDQPGQAHALNRGAAAASGRSLLFLDSDDLVTPGYLRRMAEALDRDRFVASRLDCDSLNPPWLRRSRPPTQTDGIGAPFAFMPSAAGCSIGIRKSLFDEIGGFDPEIILGNDVDLCWRVQLASYDLNFVPDAVVQYRYRDTFRGIFRQARTYGTAGPTLYRKYRSLGMPRRSPKVAARFHLATVKRLMTARSKSDLAALIFLLGFRVGIVEGCLRNRVLYL